MKLLTKISNWKAMLSTAFMLFVSNIIAVAQDQNEGTVTVDKAEVGGWFSENWMYVAGGVVLLIIIIFAMGGSSRSSRTTTTRQTNDGVTRTTSTTVTED